MQTIACFLCRKISLKNYYQAKTFHTGHISSFQRKKTTQIDTKEQSSKFLPSKGWQIIQLNSKWVSPKPCSTEITGLGKILVANSLFYRTVNLFFCPLFVQPRKHPCHKFMSISRDFTDGLSPWAGILPNSGSHWHYTGRKRVKISCPTAAESLAGWASLAALCSD